MIHGSFEHRWKLNFLFILENQFVWADEMIYDSFEQKCKKKKTEFSIHFRESVWFCDSLKPVQKRIYKNELQ